MFGHILPRDAIHSAAYAVVLFLVSHFNFLFVPCGRLSWLPVSFLLHVKYTLSYRIVCSRGANGGPVTIITDPTFEGCFYTS